MIIMNMVQFIDSKPGEVKLGATTTGIDKRISAYENKYGYSTYHEWVILLNWKKK